jgi:hypothetical protein
MKSDAIKFIQKKIIRILAKLRFLRSWLSYTLVRRSDLRFDDRGTLEKMREFHRDMALAERLKTRL